MKTATWYQGSRFSNDVLDVRKSLSSDESFFGLLHYSGCVRFSIVEGLSWMLTLQVAVHIVTSRLMLLSAIKHLLSCLITLLYTLKHQSGILYMCRSVPSRSAHNRTRIFQLRVFVHSYRFITIHTSTHFVKTNLVFQLRVPIIEGILNYVSSIPALGVKELCCMRKEFVLSLPHSKFYPKCFT